jgi:hypothetical protein
LHREYAALVALPYYDFFDHIMRPRLSRKPTLDKDDVRSAMTAYGLNEPQAIAVLSSLRAETFSLIQGYGQSHVETDIITENPQASGNGKDFYYLRVCFYQYKRHTFFIRN